MIMVDARYSRCGLRTTATCHVLLCAHAECPSNSGFVVLRNCLCDPVYGVCEDLWARQMVRAYEYLLSRNRWWGCSES